ncbi:hypothetical protein ACHAXS_001793 [Conticribra weissflogii]
MSAALSQVPSWQWRQWRQLSGRPSSQPSLVATLPLPSTITSVVSSATASSARLGIQNLMLVAEWLFLGLSEETETLVDTLVLGMDFSLEQHWDQVKSSRAALWKDQGQEEMDFLVTLTGGDREMENQIATTCEPGTWLMALPQHLSSTKLCPFEFRDALKIQYCKKPLDLESTCNGCGNLTFHMH